VLLRAAIPAEHAEEHGSVPLCYSSVFPLCVIHTTIGIKGRLPEGPIPFISPGTS